MPLPPPPSVMQLCPHNLNRMKRKMLQQSDCLSEDNATGNLSQPLHDWVNYHKEM